MSDPRARLTLERYLRDLPNLDVAQVLAIAAAHNEIDPAELERARATAARVARDQGALDDLKALHGTIAQWIGAHLSKSRTYTLEGFTDNQVLGDAREQARPAMLDAATGLFLGRWLAPDDRDALVESVEDVLAG